MKLIFSLLLLAPALFAQGGLQRSTGFNVFIGDSEPASCHPGDIYVQTSHLKVCKQDGTGLTQMFTAADAPTSTTIGFAAADGATKGTVAFTSADFTCSSGVCTFIPTRGWAKYSVAVKAACVSTNPCWTVNGVEGADLAGALTQDVVLFQLPASNCVEFGRAKTSTAFTGATTVGVTFGVAGTNNFYQSTSYDLKAAVSATNLESFSAGKCSTTTAAINAVAGITTTVANISALAATSAFDVWVKTSPLP